ncbi:PH domain-containing protein [Prochlorococcus marinus]|uniref:YdbS-like PH domain-containing protein n=1 Tax=Prochlorococcus marinus (strain MIT 9211) TaxID=93059 RepID=A9BBJ1_PROM4|nr:PH domain-containing protein [Prochlorococcus marinus]ABX09203.1 conserved hypothetical protein [Prochlorococcus marinus str. MIT 9211]
MINSSEKVFFEGPPAKEDLVFNLLAGLTIIGLPFTFGALVRALWLRFKVTNKRISVTGGWFGRDKTQVVYSQISQVRSIPRGLGTYGDMVVVTKDGEKLEMRSIPNFREVSDYIQERIDQTSSKSPSDKIKGF